MQIRINNLYLISEILKDERNLVEYSQGKLAEILEIDIKTVSRIERGKSTPKIETLKSIKNYFNIVNEKFQPLIVTNNFFLVDVEKKISRFSSKNQNKKAEVLFELLKKQLSIDKVTNRQYVLFMEILFNFIFNRKSIKKLLKELEEVFLITRTRKHLSNIGRFIPTELESKIINAMAVFNWEIGNTKKTINLLEEVIKKCKKSKVDIRQHESTIVLLCTNLSYYYLEIGKFEKSLRLVDDTISFLIQCKKVDKLGFLLKDRLYALSKTNENKNLYKKDYKHCYQLLLLIKAGEFEKKLLEKDFKCLYNERID